MKRTLDLLGSIILLILLSPILIIVYVLIRTKLGKPVLFKQVRPGVNGELFTLYKFRTMTNGIDKYGQLLDDEFRLTPFGSLLRKYSLDEIPQLLNVIRGELSLVGPRPLLVEYLQLYTKEEFRRHLVKPGITGWAQINGRNNTSWTERLELDLWYVNNHNLLLDLKILFMTIGKVFRSEGINKQGHVTMEKFQGTNRKASGDGA
jgi:sugar transferase EpsL